jgi:hypothetical protein
VSNGMSDSPQRPPAHCEFCQRHISNLTRHHLIPRTRHRNKKTRRQFDRQAMTTRIAWLCRPCHKQLHALFSEKELAESYHHLDALRQHPEMQHFIEWIVGKPENFVPRTYSKRR